MKAKRIAVIVFATIGVATTVVWAGKLALTGILMSAFAGTCTDTVASETISPNGKLKAVLYVRDCGATTRASTKIAILPASKNRPGYGDAIVFSGYEVPWDGPTHKVTAEWTGDNALTVKYARDVELTALNNFERNVHISFELTP